MSQETTLVVQHAELGICHEVPIKDPERASPALMLAYLERLGVLPMELPHRPYMVIAAGKRLVPHESFARQGVGDRCVLTVVTRGLGAAESSETTFSPSPFATSTRRALDFETMKRSFPAGGPVVREWHAYRSVATAETGRPTLAPEHATVFIVKLAVRSPIAADVYSDLWTLRLNAAPAGYPMQGPEAHVLDATKPWNPHVRSGDGYVCPGSLWHPSKLLAFYVIDILRVLNFDFGADMSEVLGHYQPEAVLWWKGRYYGEPIGPCAYPTVSTPEVSRVLGDEGAFGPPTTRKGTPAALALRAGRK